MSPQVADVLVREVMPLIQSTVPQSVKTIGSEDHAELVQDCVVMAAMMLDAMEQAGKPPMAKSVAYYAIQRIKSGRRSYSAGRTDVLSPGAQLDSRCVVVSLEAQADSQDDQDLTLGESLACRGDDPATVALRDIDWSELEEVLGDRKRQVIQAIHEGYSTGHISKTLKVSAPRVTQLKREIGDVILEQWGGDVLQEVDSEPMWKSGLRARQMTVT